MLFIDLVVSKEFEKDLGDDVYQKRLFSCGVSIPSILVLPSALSIYSGRLSVLWLLPQSLARKRLREMRKRSWQREGRLLSDRHFRQKSLACSSEFFHLNCKRK